MNFNPIFDRVVIKRDDSALKKRTSAAGIVLPDQVEGSYKSSEGILVKCSDDCAEVVKQLTGKRVLFARYSGDDIKVGGEEYVLATDGDIFGELT